MKTLSISPKQLIFPSEDIALRPAPSPEDKDTWERLLNLKDSISKEGMLSLFTVCPKPDNKFMVLDGSRRAVANMLLCREGNPDFQKINVNVSEVDDIGAIEAMFVGNAHQDPTKPVQYAKLLMKLMYGKGLNLKELAKAVSKSTEYVAKMLKINNLPELAKVALQAGKMSLGNAIQLSKLKTDEDIEKNIEDACTFTGEKFGASVAKTLADQAKARRDDNVGKAPEFSAAEKFVGKDTVKLNFEKAKVIFEKEATPFNKGYLAAYLEILSLDEKAVSAQKTEWDKKQKVKEDQAAKRKSDSQAKKKIDAVKFLKEAGIKSLDDIEAA